MRMVSFAIRYPYAELIRCSLTAPLGSRSLWNLIPWNALLQIFQGSDDVFESKFRLVTVIQCTDDEVHLVKTQIEKENYNISCTARDCLTNTRVQNVQLLAASETRVEMGSCSIP